MVFDMPDNQRQPLDTDRLALRHPPEGQAVMHQNWGKLLFMHWRVDESLLRPLIPKSLSLDLFAGSAWLAVTPFTMWDVRALPPYVPGIPGLSSMHELNVRTYVYHDGVPGVWFFSLEINSEVAAIAARTFFHLPYHHARIELTENGDQIQFKADRNARAYFRAAWSIGEPLPFAQPGSLEFFLVERYCLYAESGGRLYRARIYHQPWPLKTATLHEFDTNLFEANRLPVPQGDPLLHYAEEVNVDIWYLERV